MRSDSDQTAASKNIERTLRRRLKVWHVVCLAMADASPAMAVLLLTAGVFATGGTFAVGALLILAIVVMMIALCLGELGSVFPTAGGSYSVVSAVLPAPFAWITMFNFLLQGVFIPASLALGIVIFLKNLFPVIGLPDELLALGLLALAGAISATRVEMGAAINIVILVVQIIVVGIIILAAFIAPQHGLVQIISQPVVLQEGTLVPVSLMMAAATLAPAFNVLNGYDACLGFSEELIGGEKVIGKTVVLSALLAAILIVAPLIAAVIAAPDMKVFLSAESPVVYAVNEALGPWASTAINIGVIAALFNAMLTLLMYFARGVYSTGRDQVWPAKVSAYLGSLNRFRSPAWGVLALTLPGVVLVFMNQLDWLIIFSGTLIATVYFFVGLAALLSRVTQKNVIRPFLLPWWPLPPLIVVVFTGFALSQQDQDFLMGELVLITAALLLWLGSLSWRHRR